MDAVDARICRIDRARNSGSGAAISPPDTAGGAATNASGAGDSGGGDGVPTTVRFLTLNCWCLPETIAPSTRARSANIAAALAALPDPPPARHDFCSRGLLSIEKARRCTAMDWIFILAYCFAIPRQGA